MRFREIVDLINGNIKMFNGSIIIYVRCDIGRHLVSGGNMVKIVVSLVLE